MAKKTNNQPDLPNVSNYEFVGKNSGGNGMLLGNVRLKWATITDVRIEQLLTLDNELWSRYWKKKKSSSIKED